MRNWPSRAQLLNVARKATDRIQENPEYLQTLTSYEDRVESFRFIVLENNKCPFASGQGACGHISVHEDGRKD